MNSMMKMANRLRSEGDPRVVEAGPGSLKPADQVARVVGWMSLALGVSQLFGARGYTRALGIEGREGLVRLTGLREIGHGVVTLSTERRAGLWSRVGGDVLDLGMLTMAIRESSKRAKVVGAMTLVVAVMVIDVLAAQAQSASRRANIDGDDATPPRDYRDRSGFPQGLESARGAAAPPREIRDEQPQFQVAERGQIMQPPTTRTS